MPFYEYRCDECGHELEKMQKISDAPLTDCPECGKPALKKLISAAGFRLKGGGWYETDFKKGNQKNLHDSGEKKQTAKSEGSDSKEKKTGGDKPAAAKPAAKTAA
ncbi:zinc ribbon domain-containing protein [Thiorhodococcus mannitoliphagus]|uniref:Zinc ribbon domain-containing protein n=1 Tax=Thiorhodococcus mannitoliphagus TaxID=329406 RepID=A0A6P1DYS3_9GAMM|nr:zinc ribbon domain-containing protein [Thiorhodococcus mannitoliphagus]NEX22630.1 zinc ribbon domain-containing protein [Thiorhodococcus mannitoliphagus]